jgi:hypothetical protein
MSGGHLWRPNKQEQRRHRHQHRCCRSTTPVAQHGAHHQVHHGRLAAEDTCQVGHNAPSTRNPRLTHCPQSAAQRRPPGKGRPPPCAATGPAQLDARLDYDCDGGCDSRTPARVAGRRPRQSSHAVARSGRHARHHRDRCHPGDPRHAAAGQL